MATLRLPAAATIVPKAPPGPRLPRVSPPGMPPVVRRPPKGPAGSNDPELTRYWTEKFNGGPAFVGPEWQGGEYTRADFAGPEWQGGDFQYNSFVAPDANAMYADPGYQFRVDAVNRAIQRGAAAKGTLLSGGTVRELARENSGLASQEYANVYDRRLGEHTLGYGQARDQHTMAYGKFGDLYNRRAGEWATNYEKGASEFDRNYGQFGDLYNRRSNEWSTAYNKNLGEYNLRRNIFEQNRDQKFNKLYQLAGLGRT